MKSTFRKTTLIVLALVMILVSVPVCVAAQANEIKIENVSFEEYFDHSGEKNERMVLVTVQYTVPTQTESVSLLFLGKNTVNPSEIETKTIYIDQIDNPTGQYQFAIEKARISSALGVDNIEGSTLYLKMGATGIDTPDIKEVLYITPSPLTFDGASVRITGEQGLRFTFSIPKDLYEKLKKPESSADTGLGFGGVVLPKDMLGNNALEKGIENAKTVPAVKIFDESETHVWFTVVITGIKQSNYTREYVAVPYITYLDGGVETTVYGPQSENISVFGVAELAYEGNETAETKSYLYDNVLSVVDSVKYPKK